MAQTIADGTNEVWLSPVSVWEAMLLIERGRIEVDGDPRGWIERVVTAMPVRDAVLNREVAMVSRRLQLPHEDPADRFIAATTAVYGLTLITADQRLAAVPGIAVIANT